MAPVPAPGSAEPTGGPERTPDRALLVVHVVNAARAPLSARRLRDVIRAGAREPAIAAAIMRLSPGPATLTVRVTGAREIRRLHLAFFRDPEDTDVLSFPSGTAAVDGYLGDVALGWPAVVRQAVRYGHPAETEAALLSLHGVLHLLGWDHATEADEQEMTDRVLTALARSGLAPPLDRLPER